MPFSIASFDKPIDRMDRLADMAHFPVLVNAGATANILLTIAATWWIQPRLVQFATLRTLAVDQTTAEPLLAFAPLLWTALVLALNLAPVILLRAVGFNTAPIPSLRRMDFGRDQHRFSDWVYLAASANMAFWILTSWALFSVSHTVRSLLAMVLVASVVTFSPVLLRLVGGQPK